MNKTKKKNFLGRVIVIAMITSMFMVVFPMTASAATGDDCTDPIVVNISGDLPYTDTGQTTCGRVDDYHDTCLGSYDGGEDIIYRLDVIADTTVDITMDPTGTGWTGICIDDVCPPGNPCMAKDTGSSGTRTLTCIDLTAGNSYYIMVDTYPTPDCIPVFDLTITVNKKMKTVHPTDPAADYTTIQDAIDAACDGGSIEVWNSTYYENVVVDKRLTIYSRDGADVTIVDGGDISHVFRVDADSVNITGFTVTNSGSAGIYVNSDHNNITGNTVNNNNGDGIDIYYADYNNITNNTVNDNDDYGIILYGSDYNNIINNTVRANGEAGVFLSSYCNDNVVSTNTITNNGKIGTYSKAGIRLSNADNNEIVCNLVASNEEDGIYLRYGATGNNISYNNIVANGAYNSSSSGWEWNLHNDQSDSVAAENNYWGTTVSSKIAASIKENTGYVDYEPFLSDPSPCAPPPVAEKVIPADVTIEPETLNVKSNGEWITAYIELPESYNVADINCSTIRLEEEIAADSCDRPLESVIGDHDEDGIPDLMVKFDRAEVIEYLEPDESVELCVTGDVAGKQFKGCDTIRVIE